MSQQKPPIHAMVLESKFKAEQTLMQQQSWAKEMQLKYSTDLEAEAAADPNVHVVKEKSSEEPEGQSLSAFERLVTLVAAGMCQEVKPCATSPQPSKVNASNTRPLAPEHACTPTKIDRPPRFLRTRGKVQKSHASNAYGNENQPPQGKMGVVGI